MKKDAIGVVILAAGSSSRLGYAKQLVQFRGKPLIQNTIDLMSSFELKVNCVVVGARANEILENTDLKTFSAVSNEDWQEGMASSIRAGLNYCLTEYQHLEHIIVLLADQPFVTSELIEGLITKHFDLESDASFCEYNKVVGVPAIFSKKNFSALKGLSADQGAKKLLKDTNFEYQTVKFDQGFIDVDTAEDVLRLKQLE
ncbi:NTP transferase domain-containing protein [Flavobacterium sp. 14A]|uniref:nucleotidyltransferase family protein n=1 Tax=Flavobacterium sp. 14A TaxID=2735896 RepID=UPI00156E0937|nr:nucleotidyltransferase family protein [Flavobacterium sp. 14A]NRT13547.1 molybdenum cofactor cytidylyltransferase [Flavobacterium sp. 14A]